MNNKLEKKYGLFTAIGMVAGIVIGSGVFFKAQNVLNNTNGNMPLGILAWIIGGAVMLICLLNFSGFATKYEKVNGIVDYSEAMVGSGYAYAVAWFLMTIYYPGMTSVLAWLSARYTLEVFGNTDATSGLCIALACFYLCLSFAINALSPKLAGKLQVGTTVIKLIPLAIVAVVGTIVGIVNGTTADAFDTINVVGEGSSIGSALFAAVVSTAFAYEGWIIATSINAELKNAKKNLPIALLVGGIIIVATYVLYYIGIAGSAPVGDLIDKGAVVGFKNLFGNVGGTVIMMLVVVSCLGTLNGLMVASTRAMYCISARKEGPAHEIFEEISEHTNMPYNSAIIGLAICAAWLFYFYGANLTKSIFGPFTFDSSELPIITIYAFYIPIFIRYIKMYGKENVLKNVVLPVLGIVASVFMIFAAVWSHGYLPYIAAKEAGNFSCPALFYLIVFALIMLIGAAFYKTNKKNKK